MHGSGSIRRQGRTFREALIGADQEGLKWKARLRKALFQNLTVPYASRSESTRSIVDVAYERACRTISWT